MALGQLHLGGPDRRPRLLRDLLQAHVEASPPGSSIDWCTPYFRDEALAESLIRASDRGVLVTLTLEAEPRRKGANADVIARLGEHGLNGGLRLFRPRGLLPHPHLHARIYAFSAPRPIAFIGSFDPSAGDEDRGHHLLLGVEDPAFAEALRLHAATIPKNGGLIGSRLTGNHVRRSGGTSLYFYPRLRSGQVERELHRLGTGDRVRAAISHLKGTGFVKALGDTARRGADVALIINDSEGRLPERDIARLREAGASVRRYGHPRTLPMHARFVLIDRPEEQAAWLGSANFSPRSRWIDQEILLRTSEPNISASLATRFAEIAADPCCEPG